MPKNCTSHALLLEFVWQLQGTEKKCVILYAKFESAEYNSYRSSRNFLDEI